MVGELIGGVVVVFELKGRHEWQQYVSNGMDPIVIVLFVKLSQ